MLFRAGSYENAEDIVQTAFYRACKYYKGYDKELSLGAWLNRILNNAFTDFKKTERGHLSDEFVDDMGDVIECSRYTETVMREILSEIESKNASQKEILLLYFEQEYTVNDVCKIVDLPYKTVHQTIQRFRNDMKCTYQ